MMSRLSRGTGREMLPEWVSTMWSPLVFAFLTVVMTYPAMPQLGERIVSSSEDTWIFWWNNWWVKKALGTGRSVYFTRSLFFPHGVDLSYHSFSWLNSAIWLVLEPIVGDMAAYNVTVLLVFPLAGWGMERLVHHLTGSGGAAFVAGLIYAFIPYRVGQSNHLTLIGTQWVPFYTLFLLQAIESARWQHIGAATLFLVLTALVGWNLLVYLLIWTGWIAVHSWIAQRIGVRQILTVLVPLFLIGGLALSPLLAPMLGGRFGEEDTLGSSEQEEIQEREMQTDLMAYVLPNKHHPLWGKAVEPYYDRIGASNRPSRVVSVGFTVMVLLGFGLLARDVRRCSLWWGGILLWWICSLGSFLRFGGVIYRSIPLPYYPLSKLYVFQLLKIPDRFNLMLSLPVAVIVGYAVSELSVRRSRARHVALLASLSALILFEYLSVPLETRTPEVGRFYKDLREEAGSFAIIELPIDLHDAAKRYMLFQTVHEKPIVEGHVSRRPKEATAFINRQPLLRGLYHQAEIEPSLTDISRQLHELRDAGFKSVVLHKQFIDIGHASRWRDYLTISPRYEDDGLVVFSTDPKPGIDFHVRRIPEHELGIVESIVAPAAVATGETLSVEIRWGASGRLDEDFSARLRLLDARREVRQQWVRGVVEEWPTSEWGAGDLGIALYSLPLRSSLPAGSYTLTVALDGPNSSSPGIEIGKPRLHNEGAGPRGTIDDDHHLGQHITLRQARMSADDLIPGSRLDVNLVWESDGRIEETYKGFCHIISEDGGLVAQQDSFPVDGVRPTSTWRAGEVIEDSCGISLPGELDPGTYEVSVGMYHSESSQRLPVYDATGEPTPHGRIGLGSVQVEVEGSGS